MPPEEATSVNSMTVSQVLDMMNDLEETAFSLRQALEAVRGNERAKVIIAQEIKDLEIKIRKLEEAKVYL